ncbi:MULTISPECIES: GGDEF domain-containing protein [Streptomyces]|uniref:GGDEF domain-containing protein n=1 Tax=Streptomyces griseocarneus TaxID=51201 RepID=A0ABX7RVC0_9ACTN|nr:MULTISPECIES: GGDEF domain-containing protein [Streptomyces]QSY52251.1 GGDEF domain-containing protein [Streptomyces griseocarneus]
MDTLLAASVAAGPVAAGWSLHTLLLRHRIDRARRDPLTGLPGRGMFEATARRALRKPGGVVVLIDLDRFKALNDAHGHAAGDAVLAAAAERLSAFAVLLDGCAGRLGGDEFALVVFPQRPDCLSFDLGGLHEDLCEPVPFRGTDLRVGASIGAFATTSLPAPDLSRALRLADEAMYDAKKIGGGWRIARSPIPSMTSTHGRRTGRRGTTPRAGAPR